MNPHLWDNAELPYPLRNRERVLAFRCTLLGPVSEVYSSVPGLRHREDVALEIISRFKSIVSYRITYSHRFVLVKRRRRRRKNKLSRNVTILLSVFIGLLNVSLMRLAGGFFGLLDGVCTAQHLINNPMKMMKAIPIKRTAHQYSCGIFIHINLVVSFRWKHSEFKPFERVMEGLTVTHCATVDKVSLLNKRFFNRASGPSASTALHFKKTSQ